MNTMIKTCLTAVMVLSATLANAGNNNNNNGNSAVSTTASTSISTSYMTSSSLKAARVVSYKTSFVKDEQGRVINKIVYKEVDGFWKPLGAYSVHYGEDENILTYAQWDKVNHTFTKNAQQQHFDSKDFPVLMVDSNGE